MSPEKILNITFHGFIHLNLSAYMLVRAVRLVTKGDKDPESSILVKFLKTTRNHE
jgi:hypothetical protein